MKHILLNTAVCLLALVLALVACGGPVNNAARTSAAGETCNPRQEQQSGANQRTPSEPSTSREQAPLDYGSKLTAEVSDLQGLITDLHGRMTDREIIIELPTDVLFDFDKADIRPDAVSTLEKLARLIQQSGQSGEGAIQVNGHTDSIGSDAYNLELSERRAASVARWLTTNAGIDAGRLKTKGFGKARPLATNKNPDGSDDPEGRQKNRRVEVIIPRK
jgi:outer membrane protein OmpA-like peptidoglycan-associated protein